VFVQLQQRITDTELAAATGIPRPHVNRWRSGQAMPNVVHVASMPDDAFLFVVRGVLNARVTYGKRAYRIVEVDGDDRSVEREARVAQLEATCKQLTAAVAQLTELVQQMQVGK
jgi:transcriptional regulator with XRE-family HTH domain